MEVQTCKVILYDWGDIIRIKNGEYENQNGIIIDGPYDNSSYDVYIFNTNERVNINETLIDDSQVHHCSIRDNKIILDRQYFKDNELTTQNILPKWRGNY